MYFARHETFYIREGWLYKGMSAIKKAEKENELPTIFMDKDGPERLGIGRNMVHALRFWIRATGLSKEKKEQGKTVHQLTPFGEWVWRYDPYFDDEATLWLIHYHLVCSRELATTWYWFFNHFTSATFDTKTCTESLKLWVISEHEKKKVAESSLNKDVNCLIKTYLTKSKTKKETPEALNRSPLARLGLLVTTDNNSRTRYRLQKTNLTYLHPLILLYVLIDQQQKRKGEWQVGLSKILREPMNAGAVFQLTTITLTDILTRLNKQYPDWIVKFERTAGLDQLVLPRLNPCEILDRYEQEQKRLRKIKR